MKSLHPSFIELLESRIAPAILNAAGTVLTYTDIDGDLVKVTFTGGAKMVAADFTWSTGGVDGTITTKQSLQTIDLTGHTGGGFTLTATPQKIGGVLQGDSHAAVGYIDASIYNLGTIVVDGDVSRITAGSGAPGTLGIKSFTALSMGLSVSGSSADSVIYNAGSFMVKTDLANQTLTFNGGVKSFTVGGNIVEYGSLQTRIYVPDSVGTFKVGGSIIAGASGVANLFVFGSVGTLSVGKSIQGGDANLISTQIEVVGRVKSFTIGGDLRSGSADGGGSITLGSLGTLKIGGSIIGEGSSKPSLWVKQGVVDSISIRGSMVGGAVGLQGFKQIYVEAPVKSFTLGGDLVGGANGGGSLQLYSVDTFKIGGSVIGRDNQSNSGSVRIFTYAKSIAIGGSIIGGNVSGNSISSNGFVGADSGIGTFKLGGDFIGGGESGGGQLSGSSMISTFGTIGSLTIGGSIRGTASQAAYISAGGGEAGSAPVAAIKTLSIKGSVLYASILAGYAEASFTQNTDSGFGSITIGGNLAGSYITWGANKGADNIPGNFDDSRISDVALFGSVKIGGIFSGIAGDSKTYYIYGSILKKATIGEVTYTQTQLNGLQFNAIGKAVITSSIR